VGPGSGGVAEGSGGESGGGVASNCSGSLSAGETNRTVQIDGMDRKFIMHIPQGYSATEPVPLLIDWHPLGSSGSGEKGLSGFNALSDKEGFIVLWPDGIDNAWNVGPCCTNSRDIDDVAFARAMVDDLVSIACVDQKKIYSAGFSMGGGMSHYLACHAADVFAAVAPSAFDLLTENVDGCDPARPVSVFATRGTNDTTVPFNGGPGSSGKATFLGAQQTFEKWGELNGCTGEATKTGDSQMFTSCTAGVEVGLLTIQGGGHAPGSADVAWEFLKTKSLP
jgi:polyhydroxybutyrate depolymerase